MARLCPTCRLLQTEASHCRACGLQLSSTAKYFRDRSTRILTIDGFRWGSLTKKRPDLYLRMLVGLAILGIGIKLFHASAGWMVAIYWIICLGPFPDFRWQERSTSRLSAVRVRPIDAPIQRGRVRAEGPLVRSHLDGVDCVAAEVSARAGEDCYVWAVRAAPMSLELEDGRRVKMTGPITITGAPSAQTEGPGVLSKLGGPTWKLPLTEVVLTDGDEVEVRGVTEEAQVEAGYRESAAVEQITGRPGRPLAIAKGR